MGVSVLVGAKGGPGATTAAAALACGWPGPVLLVDADPAGGDVVPGWLAGRVGTDRGLLTFAAATRHQQVAAVEELLTHAVRVPDSPGVLVLPGIAHAGQAGGLDGALWSRLAATVRQPWPQFGQATTIVDAGRVGGAAPWPLLAAADMVLLVVRPTLRGVFHAGHALSVVVEADRDRDPGRVGLLLCGPGPYRPGEIAAAVGAAVRVVLPADPRGAAWFSDGGTARPRSLLVRAAQDAARALARDLARSPAGAVPGVSGGWR